MEVRWQFSQDGSLLCVGLGIECKSSGLVAEASNSCAILSALGYNHWCGENMVIIIAVISLACKDTRTIVFLTWKDLLSSVLPLQIAHNLVCRNLAYLYIPQRKFFSNILKLCWWNVARNGNCFGNLGKTHLCPQRSHRNPGARGKAASAMHTFLCMCGLHKMRKMGTRADFVWPG